MSRLDELLSALLDRTPLSTAEFAELDALLAQPAGQARARRLLQIEATLRATEPLGEIAQPVLAQLAAARASQTLADDVLARIARDPVMRWNPRSPRRWPWLAAAAAVVAFAAGLVWLYSKNPRASRSAPAMQVAVLEGEYRSVTIGRKKDVLFAAEGGALQPGDRILVGPRSHATLTLEAGRTQVRLAPDTRLTLSGTPAAPLLRLRGGALDLAVQPRAAAQPLRVESAAATAIVRGTKFRFAETASGTWLTVSEGRVDFRRTDHHALLPVGAQQFAVAAAGVPFTVHPLPADGVARLPVEVDFRQASTQGDAEWVLQPRRVLQRRVSVLPAYAPEKGYPASAQSVAIARIAPLPALLFEATVDIDAARPDTPAAQESGVGLGLHVGTAIHQFRFRSIQDPGLHVLTFRLADRSVTGLLSEPRHREFTHEPRGTWRLRVAASRDAEGRARLRGKMWAEGTPEPAWQLEVTGPFIGDYHEVGLEMTRLACTFRDLAVWRIE